MLSEVSKPSAGSRYDLHVHSRYSYDSLLHPRAIVSAALKQGLRGIAVTDHGTIAGAVSTRLIAPPGLIVVVGAEIHTEFGDVVGLFLEREVRSRKALEVIDEIHGQGGIAFLPHPLRSHPLISDGVLDAVDGYEVLNSRAGFFTAERSAAPQTVASSWSRLAGKARLGCSDAHLAWEVGRAFTLLSGEASEANLRARLLAGDCEPGGSIGNPTDFYLSQAIKLVKTRDARMLSRLARRIGRKLVRGATFGI